jgi:hypothetical protein
MYSFSACGGKNELTGPKNLNSPSIAIDLSFVFQFPIFTNTVELQ